MELLVKRYADQPSRIAVRYIYEYQATKAYQDLVHAMENGSVQVVAEIKGKQIDLTLISDFNGKKIFYRALEFHQKDMEKMLLLQDGPSIFVHVYPKQNTLMVARPWKKSLFLQVSRLELRGTGFQITDGPALAGGME